MLLVSRILAIVVSAHVLAQSCPRPTPPASGFSTQIDGVVPVTYSDGYQTFGTLIWPAVSAPSCAWPLVVFVHPLGGSRVDDHGLQLAVAAQGYAVWSYDVRGQGQAVLQNPSHPQAGTTLWGPVERCDLAEQILFVAQHPAFTGLVDTTRVAVVGSSQGGAHAWNAAAWSGLPLTVPGRPPLVFPTIRCVVANDFVANLVDDWLRGGVLWSAWFVEALAGSYAGLPIDAGFLQAARAAFVAQDAAGFRAALVAEGRDLTALLSASSVPVLYSHSYYDRVDNPSSSLAVLAAMSSPRRVVLSTGGHNSSANVHERAYRDAMILRWLHRWLWDEQNEIEIEAPFVLAEPPLDRQLREDAGYPWNRHHGPDPLVTTAPTRLFLHDDSSLRGVAPVAPQTTALVAQVIDPLVVNFTAADFLNDPLVRNLTNVLSACPLNELVYSHVLIEERELDASPLLHLRVVPHSVDWMVSAQLTVEPLGPGAEEFMLASGAMSSSSSTAFVPEEHSLALSPIAARLPAGATLRLRLRNLWVRESPMARQLEVAPRFHDFRVAVVHADAVGGSWIDLPLHAVRPKISANATWFELATAAPLALQVRGGTARAGKPYFVTFGVSGHLPMTPFLNGTMPIESDWLVGIISTSWWQPEFTNFLGILDGSGNQTAVVNFSGHAPLPAALTGLRLSIAAFVFETMMGVSGSATNPCDVFLR